MPRTMTLTLAVATGLLVAATIPNGTLAAPKGAERGIIIVNSKPGAKAGKWYTPGAAKRAPALGGPDTKIKK